MSIFKVIEIVPIKNRHVFELFSMQRINRIFHSNARNLSELYTFGILELKNDGCILMILLYETIILYLL